MFNMESSMRLKANYKYMGTLMLIGLATFQTRY